MITHLFVRGASSLVIMAVITLDVSFPSQIISHGNMLGMDKSTKEILKPKSAECVLYYTSDLRLELLSWDTNCDGML